MTTVVLSDEEGVAKAPLPPGEGLGRGDRRVKIGTFCDTLMKGKSRFRRTCVGGSDGVQVRDWNFQRSPMDCGYAFFAHVP